MLGEPMADSVPHAGEHEAPFAVSVHVTPALAESFATEAFTVTADVPEAIVVIGFVIVTLTGVPFVIVKGSDAFFREFATDVAIIVGELLGDAGYEVGGVYDALKLGLAVGVRLPQAGAHDAPFAVRLHETPALVESFCTVALTVTAADPEAMDVMELEIATVIGKGVILPPPPPEPHRLKQQTAAMAAVATHTDLRSMHTPGFSQVAGKQERRYQIP